MIGDGSLKKFIAVLVLIIIAVSGYVVWQAGRDSAEENILVEERVVLTPDDEVARSGGERGEKISGATEKGPERSLTPDELKELEDNFDKVEKEWAIAMDKLFTEELKLGPDALAEYEKLREAYDQDKYQAFQEYHAKLQEKYGENYQYNPTEQMEEFENTVLEGYQEKLKAQIGEEGMRKYLETLDAFNERLMREQDQNQGSILIDF